MGTLKLLGIIFLVVVGVIVLQTYLSYQDDIHAARERVFLPVDLLLLNLHWSELK